MANLHLPLVGRWSGEGSGDYPTIEPFSYRETLEVTQVPGRPLARWQTSTEDAHSGEPRHSEVGFVRSVGDACELVLAHNFGITEISVASPADATSFVFESHAMHGSPSAKSVTAVLRAITLDGDALDYELSMAAVGLAMTHHLSARLVRER